MTPVEHHLFLGGEGVISFYPVTKTCWSKPRGSSLLWFGIDIPKLGRGSCIPAPFLLPMSDLWQQKLEELLICHTSRSQRDNVLDWEQCQLFKVKRITIQNSNACYCNSNSLGNFSILTAGNCLKVRFGNGADHKHQSESPDIWLQFEWPGDTQATHRGRDARWDGFRPSIRSIFSGVPKTSRISDLCRQEGPLKIETWGKSLQIAPYCEGILDF